MLSQDRIPKDLRGKNPPSNAKPGYVIKAIHDHIASFPQKEAHYTSVSYYYLSAKLNVKIMWQLFQEKYPEMNVDYKFYLKIFHENCDLSFGRPQVDTCCKCEELKVKIKSPCMNDAAKRVYIADLLVHKNRAKKFYAAIKSFKEKCLEDSKVAAICMDFMQNLQLPQIPVQETFYLRQLTVNVFNIHNIANDKAMFYVYHEGVAKKGPNEVSSFLTDYISNVMDKDIRHLHVFSDGTGGQNKNNTIVRLFLALVELGRFDTIIHYFPIRGHSYLPCDRDFSIVKRKIRKTDRIYTMKEYVELILQSTVKSDKFMVKMVESEDVKDFKSWWPRLYKRNVISTETMARSVRRDGKQKFTICSFMEFLYSKENKGEVKAKTYIGGLQQHTFHLKKESSPPTLPTSYAYHEKRVPINKKKIDDIKKLKNYIPSEIVDEFYSEIFDWPTCENEDIEVID